MPTLDPSQPLQLDSFTVHHKVEALAKRVLDRMCGPLAMNPSHVFVNGRIYKLAERHGPSEIELLILENVANFNLCAHFIEHGVVVKKMLDLSNRGPLQPRLNGFGSIRPSFLRARPGSADARPTAAGGGAAEPAALAWTFGGRGAIPPGRLVRAAQRLDRRAVAPPPEAGDTLDMGAGGVLEMGRGCTFKFC